MTIYDNALLITEKGKTGDICQISHPNPGPGIYHHLLSPGPGPFSGQDYEFCPYYPKDSNCYLERDSKRCLNYEGCLVYLKMRSIDPERRSNTGLIRFLKRWGNNRVGVKLKKMDERRSEKRKIYKETEYFF